MKVKTAMEEEQLRQMLIDELDNQDWDMSDEGLDKVARRLQRNFRNFDEARDFVNAQSAYLADRMDEYYS